MRISRDMNNSAILTMLNIYNACSYDLIFIIYDIAIFTVSNHELDGLAQLQSSRPVESLT